ncbi:XRE family transcriptional regulator [Streptomyces griseosporeus]|uniref:XRE family transcriptional regulator n=1 Tax=Streptomyces griseosporeus TaxID=1910 RepID=UPI003701F680
MESPSPRLRPEDATDAAEFVELMRVAKERSGLTYRDLEARAAAHGDVLARSTLANTLARDALPRADLLAAFVRACEGEERVPAWLAARDRLALPARLVTGRAGTEGTEGAEGAGEGTASAPAAPRTAGTPGGDPHAGGAAGPSPEDPAARRTPRLPRPWRRVPRAWRLPLAAVAVAAAVLLAALGARELTDPGPPETAGAARGTASTAPPVVPRGPLRIRPVRSPALCLTDGFTRDGRYDSQVAVHRACAQAVPPVTQLVPAGDGTYRLSFSHPKHGVGCLAVLTGERLAGLLEPRNDCSGATRFRVERAPSPPTATPPASAPRQTRDPAPAYVLSVDDHHCLGAADPDAGPGTEAVVQTCDGSAAQQYLIGAAKG